MLGLSALCEAPLCGLPDEPDGSALLTGVAAHWPFEGDLTDVHGPHDLTADNAIGSPSYTFPTGKLGQCLEPASNDDHFFTTSFSPSDFNVADFALSFWLRDTVAGNCNLFRIELLATEEPDGRTLFAYTIPISSAPSLVIGNGSDIRELSFVADGDWHHLVLCFTQDFVGGTTDYRVFINGVQTTSGTLTGLLYDAVTQTAANVYIASSTNQENLGWGTQGQIDEVTLWCDRELTASDVELLYNYGDGLAYPFYELPPAQTVSVPVGLVDFSAPAIASRKAAAVPVLQIDFTAPSMATAKTAAVPVVSVEFVGLAPVSNITVALDSAVVDFTAPAIDSEMTASVPTGVIDLTAATMTTAIAAAVEPVGVAFSAPAIGSAKAEAVPVGRVVFVAPAASTLVVAPVAVGRVAITSLAIQVIQGDSAELVFTVYMGVAMVAGVDVETSLVATADAQVSIRANIGC